MRLMIVETLAEAARPADVAVVVDVYRAVASAHAAVQAGAEVLLARDVEHALALRAEHPDWLLVGEDHGLLPDGFDYPNSPTILADAELTGRTLVLVTDACTPAVFALKNVQQVLLASFINVAAVVSRLKISLAANVVLLAPGERGQVRSLEDTMCAMYLKNAVEEYPNNHEVLSRHLRSLPVAEMFLDSTRPDAPEQDADHCLELDRYDFTLEAIPVLQGFFRLERRNAAAEVHQGGAA